MTPSFGWSYLRPSKALRNMSITLSSGEERSGSGSGSEEAGVGIGACGGVSGRLARPSRIIFEFTV